MAGGRGEVTAVVRSLRVILRTPKTHGYRHHTGLTSRVACGTCQKIVIAGTVGLDQQDIRFGRNDMRPFDIQGNLQRPTNIDTHRGDRATELIDHGEIRWIGKAILQVKSVEIGDYIRIPMGIDNGDCLPRAIADDAPETDVVDPVGIAETRGSITGGTRRARGRFGTPKMAGLLKRNNRRYSHFFTSVYRANTKRGLLKRNNRRCSHPHWCMMAVLAMKVRMGRP